jgi:hypothetical protein
MISVQEVYNRCGSCRNFEPMFTDRMGRTMGECRGKPTHPTVGAQEFGCPVYHLDRTKLLPGSTVPEDADVSPAERERQRRMTLVHQGAARDAAAARRPTLVRRAHDDEECEQPKMNYIPLSLGDGDGESTMDRHTLKSILAEVLDEALNVSDVPMATRFKGGKVVVQPGNAELQAKEIEIDVLFRKVVAIRDKLRVLEQKINGSENLDPAEKVQIQQYITACYGTMTTFNFLFRDRDDGFAGQG